MIKRLQHSGFFEINAEEPGAPTPKSLDKKALLVYTGTFQSMDGFVEVKDEHIEKLASNHNSLLSAVSRMALGGSVPLKYFPPIQLDHSLSAKDTVGRLIGDLEIGEHEPVMGTKVKALFGTLRVLGVENVEKVMDGRWTNLSIGADLDEGKFSELTITPFPAAADASMLSSKRLSKKTEKYNGETITVIPGEGVSWYLEVGDIKRGPFQKEEDAFLEGRQIVDSGILNLPKGDSMLKKLKGFMMKTMKLSAEEADKKMAEMPEAEKKELTEKVDESQAKMKKHLTEVQKMTEEEADKKLSEMNEDEVKKLMEECDEHEKKMAADQPYAGKETPGEEALEPTHKMRKLKEELTKLSTDFRKVSDAAKLASKRADISVRLSALRSEGKVTPAEIKKIDLARLATQNDATIAAVMDSYKNREPLILTGLMGSKHETNMADVHKSVRMSKLESDIRKSMTSLGAGSKKLSVEETPKPATEQMAGGMGMETEMAEIEKMLDEGKIAEVKERMKSWMGKCMSPAGQHQGEVHAEMSGLAQSVDRMQNEFNKAMQLIGQIS